MKAREQLKSKIILILSFKVFFRGIIEVGSGVLIIDIYCFSLFFFFGNWDAVLVVSATYGGLLSDNKRIDFLTPVLLPAGSLNGLGPNDLFQND